MHQQLNDVENKNAKHLKRYPKIRSKIENIETRTKEIRTEIDGLEENWLMNQKNKSKS